MARHGAAAGAPRARARESARGGLVLLSRARRGSPNVGCDVTPGHGDGTHDASLRSWVTSANDPNSDFPIQNLPFGVFRRHGSKSSAGLCVAIGDSVPDLTPRLHRGPLTG